MNCKDYQQWREAKLQRRERFEEWEPGDCFQLTNSEKPVATRKNKLKLSIDEQRKWTIR